MDDDDLLKNARKMYPAGTVYFNAYPNHKDKKTATGKENFKIINNDITTENSNGWVYYDNVWAEIISYTKPDTLIFEVI